jgi:uncharacterized RDD family membrane protein YckC
MAGSLGSWLSGPSQSDARSSFPGERLGLPERGPGSIARFGRRIGALLVDWLIGYGLAGLAMQAGLISFGMLSTAVLGVWLVMGVVAVRLFGFSAGQYLLGLKVVSVDERGVGGGVALGRALLRGALIVFVIPALFTDADHRGLHDLASKTAVVRR